MLHEGAGELQTVTGVELVRSHRAAREDPYRLDVGLIGAEAMLRLFGEPEANAARVRRARALPRPARRGAASRTPARPALDPLALSFQLKLLWLSGYLPHLTSCVECGAADGLVGFSPRAGGAVCARARGAARFGSRPRARRDRAAALDAARRRARGGAARARRGARRSPSSRRRTRSTAASGCARCRREARPRRRASSSTTTRRGRRRRGAPVPLGGRVLGARPRARGAGAARRARRRASSASTTADGRSGSAAPRATASSFVYLARRLRPAGVPRARARRGARARDGRARRRSRSGGGSCTPRTRTRCTGSSGSTRRTTSSWSGPRRCADANLLGVAHHVQSRCSRRSCGLRLDESRDTRRSTWAFSQVIEIARLREQVTREVDEHAASVELRRRADHPSGGSFDLRPRRRSRLRRPK